MQMTQKVVIKGVSFFDGEIDGKKIKSGSLHIEEAFGSADPNSKGFKTVQYSVADPELVRPFMQSLFPVHAEVDFEINATKAGTKINVVGLREGKPAMPMPKAA